MKLAGNKLVVLTAVLFTGKVGSKVKCLSRAEGGMECCHGDLTITLSWIIIIFSFWMKFMKTKLQFLVSQCSMVIV